MARFRARAAYSEEPPAWQAWSSNELVLDTIFRFLDISADLKSARLVCKKWAICGSRPLVQNTFVRLSQVAPSAFNSQKLILPHFIDNFTDGNFQDQSKFIQSLGDVQPSELELDMWESSAELGPREYLTFDGYSEYRASASFYSGFEPRNFVVYTLWDMVHLQTFEFRCVEKLEVAFVKPSGAYALLRWFHRVFPILKCLRIGQLVPEGGVSNLNMNMILKNEDQRVPQVADKENSLEELSFPLPADLAQQDWTFLERFRNLKKLEIRWPGAFVIHDWGDDMPVRGNPEVIRNQSYRNIHGFGFWLKVANGYLKLANLTDLNLRFQLTPTNIECVATTLAAASKLKNLTLQLYGRYFDLKYYIHELDINTLSKLTTLYYSLETTGRRGDFNAYELKYVIYTLYTVNFFRKPTWTLAFRDAAGVYSIHMEKRNGQLIIQFKGKAEKKHFTPTSYLREEISYMCQDFNYSFYFGTEPFHLTQHYTSESVNCPQPAPWDSTIGNYEFQLEISSQNRRKPQLLLCDLPGFLQETGLTLGKHSKDKGFTTLSYAFVPIAVIAKWSKRLQTEQLIYNFQQLQFRESALTQELQSSPLRKLEFLQLISAKTEEDSIEEN